MRNPLRLGICGLGRAGMGMIWPELSGRTDIRVTSSFDVLPERTRKLQDLCGARPYDDLNAFLRDDQTDAVIIATRSFEHVPMAIAALRAEKHVIVEKPMAIHLKEADKLLKVAAKSESKLLVRHNRRFDPEITLARKIVKSGKIGKIHSVQLRITGFSRRADWQTLRAYGGGQLLNWGPHVIDWALQLVGYPAQDIWADLKRVAAAGDAEDNVKICFRGGSTGASADLLISGAAAMPQPMFTIYGSQGALVIDAGKAMLKHLDQQSIKEMRRVRAAKETPGAGGNFSGNLELNWIEEKHFPSTNPAEQFWDHVVASLARGKKFPVSLGEAREVMRVIDVARKVGRFE